MVSIRVNFVSFVLVVVKLECETSVTPLKDINTCDPMQFTAGKGTWCKRWNGTMESLFQSCSPQNREGQPLAFPSGAFQVTANQRKQNSFQKLHQARNLSKDPGPGPSFHMLPISLISRIASYLSDQDDAVKCKCGLVCCDSTSTVDSALHSIYCGLFTNWECLWTSSITYTHTAYCLNSDRLPRTD